MAANPEEAGKLGAETLGLEAPSITKSLENTQLEMVPATVAREEMEFFFSRLAELNPELIGGQLPDDGFYYAE